MLAVAWVARTLAQRSVNSSGQAAPAAVDAYVLPSQRQSIWERAHAPRTELHLLLCMHRQRGDWGQSRARGRTYTCVPLFATPFAPHFHTAHW
jgi:hypothetical protein